MILDLPALWQSIGALGLEDWRPSLEPLLERRLCDEAHGNFQLWRTALGSLCLSADDEIDRRRELLLSLSPWRKGPFDIGGVSIDSEWRSDMKWDRLHDAIEPLGGRNVLDVGCGNGYYALRMHEAGAHCVLGIDPTVLYVIQFLAVQHYRRAQRVHVLPLRLHELPGNTQAFDTAFSMGVLYHQRSPIDHLGQLRAALRPGGQLVLETLFIPGTEPCARTPRERYARMRNVWLLPTLSELETWLIRCGFCELGVVDESVTTPAEQRTTEWMTFESLVDALDPNDPTRTVEGWPAPRRVIIVAKTR